MSIVKHDSVYSSSSVSRFALPGCGSGVPLADGGSADVDARDDLGVGPVSSEKCQGLQTRVFNPFASIRSMPTSYTRKPTTGRQAVARRSVIDA